ncbi:hypothetical protein, variant [Aphanomyces invadans]|uniref:BZIP domain-containing protein n=1 Tax=Aphanomyces invadans TaxID=157072 RepID=A0A024U0Z9_9STRA|nr:hypothetical protein, variant [Aphanomyces invadans]ETV99581.1 hypothetical protein, variant [Aphanomyces invadans]|eukprot:XP_008872137.1 hypothetical protein, variant [Aphanomyces invadans]
MSTTLAACDRAKAALDAVKAMVPDSALAEKLLRRRLYNREQQRRHRYHKAEEAARLRIEVARLEDKKAKVADGRHVDETDTMLPWKEVCCAILESIEDTSQANRSLQKRSRRNQDLIQRITSWISSCRVPIVSHLDDKRTWRHVTLLSHPPTRKLGFDWITQQLYYNANPMFQSNNFPSLASREYLGDFHCDTSVDDSFQYTWRVQRDLHIPFDQVVRTIQDKVVHYLIGAAWSKEWSTVNVLPPVPLDTPLLREIGGKIAYGRTHRSADEDVNFLCREFSEDGKITIVAQHIHDDENLQQCKVQCNRMFWFVAVHARQTL